MSDAPTKGEQTRTQIMQAAHALFAEQGYHGTSMRQIADAAGIALGGIYNHFEGKEAIFEAVIVEFHPISELMPKLRAADGETIPEMVHFAADLVQETVQERSDYVSMILVEMIDFQGKHFSHVFGTVFPQGLDLARVMLGKRGKLRMNNIPLALFAFLSIMFGYLVFTRFLNERFLGRFVEMDLHKLIDILLYGIMAEPPEA